MPKASPKMGHVVPSTAHLCQAWVVLGPDWTRPTYHPCTSLSAPIKLVQQRREGGDRCQQRRDVINNQRALFKDTKGESSSSLSLMTIFMAINCEFVVTRDLFLLCPPSLQLYLHFCTICPCFLYYDYILLNLSIFPLFCLCYANLSIFPLFSLHYHI